MKLIDKIKNSDFHIARNGKKFIIAPAVIFLVGLVLFAIFGFNLGLDFTGGAIVTLNQTEEITESTIKDFMDGYGVKYTITEQRSDEGGTDFSVNFDAGERNNEIMDAITEEFGSENILPGGGVVSARTSGEKIVNVIWAVIAALAGILIYMIIRFKFTSGMATLLALGHDVLMMCALVIIFRIQINTPFIAALITIIGYSINNSLVVFDRVRDFERHNTDGLTLEEMLDKSIKLTVGRTSLTMLTTIILVIILAIASIILQLSTLTEFALPIIFGLIMGTYSSLFLIAPMYLRFEGARLANKNKKAKSASAK